MEAELLESTTGVVKTCHSEEYQNPFGNRAEFNVPSARQSTCKTTLDSDPRPQTVSFMFTDGQGLGKRGKMLVSVVALFEGSYRFCGRKVVDWKEPCVLGRTNRQSFP